MNRTITFITSFVLVLAFVALVLAFHQKSHWFDTVLDPEIPLSQDSVNDSSSNNLIYPDMFSPAKLDSLDASPTPHLLQKDSNNP